MKNTNPNLQINSVLNTTTSSYKHKHTLGVAIKESMQDIIFFTEMKFFKPLRSPFKA